MRTLILAAAATLAMTGAAFADPIEGNWRTKSGETAKIVPCSGGYCITLTTGEHAGRQIGKMAPSGANSYAGEITDPGEDKTYKGKASLSGGALTMKGCVLGGLICRGETWSRL